MKKTIILYKDSKDINRYLELLNKNGVFISKEDFVNIDTAIKRIDEIKPDIIFIPFIEISTERLSLIEEILSIPAINKPEIYAITEMDGESFKGFVVSDAFDKNLPQAHKQTEPIHRELHLTRLPVNKDGIVYFIDNEIILYMTTQGKETHIHTEDKIFTSEDSLKVMENRLVNSGFMKCHRSYIVNLNRIDKLTYWNNGVYFLSFKEINETIPVSRKYYKELKHTLQI